MFLHAQLLASTIEHQHHLARHVILSAQAAKHQPLIVLAAIPPTFFTTIHA